MLSNIIIRSAAACLHQRKKILAFHTVSYGSHLGGAGVHVGHVDCAGVHVDQVHGNSLPLKSGKMVNVHRANLKVIDRR